MFFRRLIVALVCVLVTLLPRGMPVAAASWTPFTVDVSSITPLYDLWSVEEISTPGGNTHLLHSVEVYTMKSDDPRYGGQITFDYRHVVQKQEHPAPGRGPGSGDWWVEVNGQRTWEGTLHMQQGAQSLTIKYVGHGVGTNEGLKLKMLNYYDYLDYSKWSITGEILDPKSK